MASAFPLEIYEHILEFVPEEKNFKLRRRTLTSASLVCHGWHPRSRALLFRTLRFNASDADTLIRFRRHLAVAPHLAAYVEEVRLSHQIHLSRLLELFPGGLAPYLPRLRAVFLTVYGDALNMHRFFCLPGIRIQNVRTLEYDAIGLRDTSELDGLLLPYPNVHALTLHEVWWVDLTNRQGGKGLPRPLKAPLTKLTELRLMDTGFGTNVMQIVNRLGYEQLLAACRGTLSTLLLNIVPIRVLVLQFKEDHPFSIIELPCLDVLLIELFIAPGIVTRIRDTDTGPVVPYAEIVSLIPRLLHRLHATKLRVLNLYFSALDIDATPDALLGHLAATRQSVEEMIPGSRFPNLKVITFDLGHQHRDLSSWQARITKCFPKLEEVGYIRVQPHDNMSEELRREHIDFYY